MLWQHPPRCSELGWFLRKTVSRWWWHTAFSRGMTFVQHVQVTLAKTYLYFKRAAFDVIYRCYAWAIRKQSRLLCEASCSEGSRKFAAAWNRLIFSGKTNDCSMTWCALKCRKRRLPLAGSRRFRYDFLPIVTSDCNVKSVIDCKQAL